MNFVWFTAAVAAPIRGQYPGHVITLSQSEASIKGHVSVWRSQSALLIRKLLPLHPPHILRMSFIQMFQEFELSGLGVTRVQLSNNQWAGVTQHQMQLHLLTLVLINKTEAL